MKKRLGAGAEPIGHGLPRCPCQSDLHREGELGVRACSSCPFCGDRSTSGGRLQPAPLCTVASVVYQACWQQLGSPHLAGIGLFGAVTGPSEAGPAPALNLSFPALDIFGWFSGTSSPPVNRRELLNQAADIHSPAPTSSSLRPLVFTCTSIDPAASLPPVCHEGSR